MDHSVGGHQISQRLIGLAIEYMSWHHGALTTSVVEVTTSGIQTHSSPCLLSTQTVCQYVPSVGESDRIRGCAEYTLLSIAEMFDNWGISQHYGVDVPGYHIADTATIAIIKIMNNDNDDENDNDFAVDDDDGAYDENNNDNNVNNNFRNDEDNKNNNKSTKDNDIEDNDDNDDNDIDNGNNNNSDSNNNYSHIILIMVTLTKMIIVDSS